ncbi:DUF86 domain-containing protein [Patescibacteria group bacterium]|nr:DUF86 domain-containing protein [Patescibacteria group bacterium]
MTELKVIEERISSIKKYLTILKKFKKYSQKELENDIFLKGSVERYLYLVIQESISLAEGTISLMDLRKPSDYGENFEILNENDIISLELSQELIKMVGFRNVIAHDYKKLDFNIVYDVLQNKLEDINSFIAEIKKSLNI